MKIESFIPYHVPFKETLVSAVSSIIFKELQLGNYRRTILSEIIETPQYGYTASASKEPVGVKYVRITDIQAGKVDWDSVPYCECDNPEKYLLKENDVLFARTGGTTGKSVIVKGKIPESVFASYLIRIRPKKGINPDFLYWFFQTKQYWSQIRTEKRGSAQPNVNGKKLSSLEVYVPGTKVQEAIAKYLNAYKNKVYGKSVELPILPTISGKTEKRIGRIELLLVSIEKARRLRAGAVKELEELLFSVLEKIFSDKSTMKVTKKVEEICTKPQYGYTDSAKYEPVGPKFLRITDIQDGKVNWERVPHSSCPEEEKYLLESGDILFARSGSTGKSFLVKSPPESIFASYLIRIKPKEGVSPEYLYWFFQSPLYWSQVIEKTRVSVQPNMNGRKLSNIQVPLPDSEQNQRYIVNYLDSLKEKVDELKKLQDETEKEIEELIPSVLNEAFSGKP